MSPRRARLGLAALLAFATVTVRTEAGAETSKAVAHGVEISRANVGPAAIGIVAGRQFEGGLISDARRPDYAALVPGNASYDGFAVRGPHLLIEGATIDGALDITTRMPVVLRGVTVFAQAETPWLVLVRPGAGPVHVLWSDIGGALIKRSAAPYAGVALALRGDTARVYRSRIGAAADGIQIAGRDIQITESEVSNLLSRDGDHNDAVQMFDTASDVSITRSRIENRYPQTSAATVLGQNITLSANVLAGGGWTLYGGAKRNGKGGPSAAGVRVEGTVFSRAYAAKVGSFGPVTYWPRETGAVWRNNRDDQGRPVTP